MKLYDAKTGFPPPQVNLVCLLDSQVALAASGLDLLLLSKCDYIDLKRPESHSAT